MGPGRERTYWSAFGAAHEADLAYDNGDYLTSRDLRQESFALFAVDGFDCFVYGRKRGVTYWQAQVYAHMGLVNWALGDYTRSEACYECSMKLRKDDGERRSQGVHMVRYARLLQTKGAYARAEDLTRKGLRLSESCGDQIGRALGHLAVGRLLAARRHAQIGRAHIWPVALKQGDEAAISIWCCGHFASWVASIWRRAIY